MDKLTAQAFRAMARASATRLEAEKARVDALNVFPVPDGDTGTNMALTLWSAVEAVLKSPSDSLDELAEAAAVGALMGARGNSGVILSQFLRGFADGVKGLDAADSHQLAQAFVKAAEAAYGAVIRPVEGTVLTVGRVAAEEALRLAQSGEDLVSVLEGALFTAITTLARTPELLATLREAGVVDAGGEGLVVAARGAFEAISSDVLQQQETAQPPKPAADAPKSAADAPKPAAEAEAARRQGITEISDLSFKYCTEFLIRGAALDKDVLQQALSDIGDSMLVVGQPGLTKVHIHTNHPGTVLEIAGSRGELLSIHINNMAEQNREASQVAEDSVKDAPPPAALQPEPLVAPELNAPTVPPAQPTLFVPQAAQPAAIAVVAVASGDGCVELLRSLGVSEVVRGGQTMNPSTAQLLEAVRQTNAKNVIILPNNGNVLMTARQAAHLANIPVAVVPTRTYCEGIAAMLQFSALDNVGENTKRMEAAIDGTTCGEITIAVRDAHVDGLEIKAGQILGISHGKIIAIGDVRDLVVTALIDKLITEDSSLVTLYYGEGVVESEVDALAAEITSQFSVEVEKYPGGQPVYAYLLSVE